MTIFRILSTNEHAALLFSGVFALDQWFSIGGPQTPMGSEMGFLRVRALLPFVTISYKVSAIVVNLIRHYHRLECNVHHVVSVE